MEKITIKTLYRFGLSESMKRNTKFLGVFCRICSKPRFFTKGKNGKCFVGSYGYCKKHFLIARRITGFLYSRGLGSPTIFSKDLILAFEALELKKRGCYEYRNRAKGN